MPACLQVQDLLARIEASGILPPLVVLQVLAKGPAFKLSLVKDYVTRQLQADNRWVQPAGMPAHICRRAWPACMAEHVAGRAAALRSRPSLSAVCWDCGLGRAPRAAWSHT